VQAWPLFGRFWNHSIAKSHIDLQRDFGRTKECLKQNPLASIFLFLADRFYPDAFLVETQPVRFNLQAAYRTEDLTKRIRRGVSISEEIQVFGGTQLSAHPDSEQGCPIEDKSPCKRTAAEAIQQPLIPISDTNFP